MPNVFQRIGGRIGAAWDGLRGAERPGPAPEQPQAPAPERPQPAPDPGIPDLGIKHIDGWAGGRIVSTTDAAEAMRAIQAAADEGKRVSFNVHDKNGWHSLYTNPASEKRHQPDPGMTASELYKRFERDGVPGTREQVQRPERPERPERQRPEQPQPQAPAPEQPAPAPEQPAPAPEQPAPAPEQPAPAPEKGPGLGGRVKGFFGGIAKSVGGLFGRGKEQPSPAPEQPAPAPEGEHEIDETPDEMPDEGAEGEPWDDFPDDWDTGDYGDSEGGDEGDTEGYDSGSVGGYQVVVYY